MMATQPIEMAQMIRVIQPLDAAYRCDRCNAQAQVEVALRAGGDLYLCSHHYNENETRLILIARRIADHRKDNPA